MAKLKIKMPASVDCKQRLAGTLNKDEIVEIKAFDNGKPLEIGEEEITI